MEYIIEGVYILVLGSIYVVVISGDGVIGNRLGSISCSRGISLTVRTDCTRLLGNTYIRRWWKYRQKKLVVQYSGLIDNLLINRKYDP
jgi:hypothetical protein